MNENPNLPKTIPSEGQIWFGKRDRGVGSALTELAVEVLSDNINDKGEFLTMNLSGGPFGYGGTPYWYSAETLNKNFTLYSVDEPKQVRPYGRTIYERVPAFTDDTYEKAVARCLKDAFGDPTPPARPDEPESVRELFATVAYRIENVFGPKTYPALRIGLKFAITFGGFFLTCCSIYNSWHHSYGIGTYLANGVAAMLAVPIFVIEAVVLTVAAIVGEEFYKWMRWNAYCRASETREGFSMRERRHPFMKLLTVILAIVLFITIPVMFFVVEESSIFKIPKIGWRIREGSYLNRLHLATIGKDMTSSDDELPNF